MNQTNSSVLGVCQVPPPGVSPILVQSNELSAQCDSLSKTIDELTARLSLVLRPCPPQSAALATPCAPSVKSDHLYRLEGILRQNRDSIERIQELMGRLEV